MKIAVFSCPSGITAEGVIQAFLDAGLPAASLKKELKKNRLDPQIKSSVLKARRDFRQLQIPKQELTHALIHVAGAAVALRYFGIKKCFVRRIAIGKRGNPQTLKLLRGFVLERLPVNREKVSLSGAAILNTFCDKEISIPAMRLEGVGFGPDHLQISIGETVAPYRRERVLLLETNIDDMSPQGFELLYKRLFKAGALDVWVEPILMKKMRPAFKLSILLNHTAQERISEVLFKETPTLGVRFLELDRFSLPRKSVRIKTRWGTVRAKIGVLDSQLFKVNPEYEDLKRIAEKRNLPFQLLQTEIKKALRP